MDKRELWAKLENDGKGQWQSIYTHGIVAGVNAQTVFDKVCSKSERRLLGKKLKLTIPQTRRLVGYVAAIHDTGKIESTFQSYDQITAEKIKQDSELIEMILEHVRHEKTSRDYFKKAWRAEGQNRRCGDTIANVLGAHHAGRVGDGHCSNSKAWNVLRQEYDYVMRDQFLGTRNLKLPVLKAADQGAVAALLLGILVLADWIASSKRFEDADKYVLNLTDEYPIRSKSKTRIRIRAARFIKDCGLTHFRVDWPDTFCGIWKNFKKSQRRQVQADVEEIMRSAKKRVSLMLIEAPPGEGKTEAGLYVAAQMVKQWGKNGFYMAMPTAATATQNIKRMKMMVDMKQIPASTHLLHGTAWLDAPQTSQVGKDSIARWLMPNRRGMLAQFGTGTVDQAMLAATIAHYSCLRLLGLSNKALIIDEIHSYDAFMDKILVRLLEWCKALEIPVVMMSATLPPHLKERMLAPYTQKPLSNKYPLITTVYENGKVEEREISKTSHKLCVRIERAPIVEDYAQIAKAAVQMVRYGGCICVMMNTVKDAQKTYRAIRSIYDGDLMLFHSFHLQANRKRIEDECVKKYGKDKSNRPKQSILVATQVVEQSMDLDFDHMFISIAPIDLVIQRIGRLHRHAETVRPKLLKEPTVTIMVPPTWSKAKATFVDRIYPKCLLLRADMVLKRRDYIRMPEDIAQVVADGYDRTKAADYEKKYWDAFDAEEASKENESAACLISKPEREYTPLVYEPPVGDDEDEIIIAKTRDSTPTVRVAVLTEDELKEVAKACVNADEVIPQMKIGNWVYDKEGYHIPVKAILGDHALAEKVMQRSVMVPLRKKIGTCVKAFNNGCVFEGAWLLAGVKIMRRVGNEAKISNKAKLVIDDEIGCEVESL